MTFTNMTPIVLNLEKTRQPRRLRAPGSQQLHLYCLLTVHRFVILN